MGREITMNELLEQLIKLQINLSESRDSEVIIQELVDNWNDIRKLEHQINDSEEFAKEFVEDHAIDMEKSKDYKLKAWEYLENRSTTALSDASIESGIPFDELQKIALKRVNY